MEIPADKRDLRYGDWECIHPGPHQPTRLFFDYELTMILRARVRDLSGANAERTRGAKVESVTPYENQ
jgi:hypothetical protein